MKPFYWQGTTNFGDYMNSWLWPKILDGYLRDDDGIRLVGIGSLLKSSLNYLSGTKVIFGTGSGYGAIPNFDDYKDWKFYFVRGPLSAKCFNLSQDKAIIDGAWLISQIEEYKRIPEKSKVSFVPHWTSAQTGNWKRICELSDIHYIDPLDDLQKVLHDIAESKVVLTESLHGAIIADYFRSPWVPISISPHFLPFKWVDWFESIELGAKIGQLPLTDAFEYLYHSKSRRNIVYQSTLDSIDHNSIKLTSEATSIQTNPGPAYRTKIFLKGKARNIRASLLQTSLQYRGFFYPNWNSVHQHEIANVMNKLTVGEKFLSDDKVRSRKIEQLSEVTERLKADYDSGILFKG